MADRSTVQIRRLLEGVPVKRQAEASDTDALQNTSCPAVVTISDRCSEFCLLDEFGAACDFR